MRLVLDRRAQRLLRRLPRHRLVSIAELALIALLAIQAARLLLVLVTPVGPLGDWRPDRGAEGGVTASPAIFAAFDPFFRLSAADGPAVVTALSLKLFGVRSDQATGRGSAIIALPDGTQSSYAVGDEILPGVRLKAVAFDSVTIVRGGADEQVFLDQSQPAIPVAPGAPAISVPGLAAQPVAAPPANLGSAVQFVPQLGGGGAGGFALQPAGDGNAFRAAGLQPGDVLVSVNGQRVTGPGDADRLRQQLGLAQRATIEVQRGGQPLTLSIGAGR